VTDHWSPISSIRDLVPLSEATAYTFWHATEYLQIVGANAGKEYFAGFNDSDQSISYTQMQVVPPPHLFEGGCPDALDVGSVGLPEGRPGIRLRTSAVGLERLDLEITLPAAEEVTVAIHDVMGRRVRVLARGKYPSGRTDLAWDGTNEAGGRAPSGIYFATLVRSAARSTVRAAFVR